MEVTVGRRRWSPVIRQSWEHTSKEKSVPVSGRAAYVCPSEGGNLQRVVSLHTRPLWLMLKLVIVGCAHHLQLEAGDLVDPDCPGTGSRISVLSVRGSCSNTAEQRPHGRPHKYGEMTCA